MTSYRVFGLNVRSEIPLPELIAGGNGAAPDVTIARGRVVGDDEPGLHGGGQSLTLVIPDVGRYRIEDGKTIVVDAVADVPERNVRLFLLGSAFGALLHQRGLLPLHANAIEIDGKAVAFMGESGAGKSTLAAWFHDRGYRVIADDVCVIDFDDAGRAIAAPGLPRLRLWEEALQFTGREAAEYDRSYISTIPADKFDVLIDPTAAAQSALPLAAIYLLDLGDDLEIMPIGGIEAADALSANTYRGSYIPKAAGQLGHWQAVIGLVHKTPIFRVRRNWSLDKLDEQGARLLEHVTAKANGA